MKLLTKELEKRFERIGNQDGKGMEAIVVARYFHLLSPWTWYATEYIPEDRSFFGYTCGFENEWGYFNLDEMESITIHGLGLERDLYFHEKTLAKALKEDGREVPGDEE